MFWADDGLDTGPILLQRECDVEPNDTVNTIYKRFLFPEGVKGTVSLTLFVCACVQRLRGFGNVEKMHEPIGVQKSA